MARSASDYLKLLQRLLPLGKAWTRAPSSVLYDLLLGLAAEPARVDLRVDDIPNERDTRTSSELLSQHENDLGLPDDCTSLADTIQERRQRAHQQLIALGQQTPAYFIDLAAALGFPGGTITEYSPFICGVSQSGDQCGPLSNLFHWTFNLPQEGQLTYFICGSSSSGDALQNYATNAVLECVIRKYKPAHTIVRFNYFGPAYDEAYDNAYDSPSGSIEDDLAWLTGAYSQAYDEAYDVGFGGAYDPDAYDDSFDTPI